MQLVKLSIRRKLKKLASPFVKKREIAGEGSGVIRRLFLDAAKDHLAEHPDLFKVLETGLPPLGEHREMFDFVSQINRDVTQGIAAAIGKSIDDASFTGLFDSIAAILAQQFVLLPYYFAVFHQNKERRLLRTITGTDTPIDAQTIRVGLFTDTLDETNGVARFIRDMGGAAHRDGRNLKIHVASEQSPALQGRGPLRRRRVAPALKGRTLRGRAWRRRSTALTSCRCCRGRYLIIQI